MNSDAPQVKKICFIGAPGCGKSTIYNSLLKFRRSKDWLTPEEAKLEIGRSYRKDRVSDIKMNIAGILLLHPVFFREKYSVLGNYALKNLYMKSFDMLRLKYNPLFKMALKGLEIEVEDPASRMIASGFFLKLARDEMLIEYYSPGKPVLFDDSVWQSVRGIKHYPEGAADGLSVSGLPVPDLVVHCFSGTDDIFRQIKKRSAEGKINTCHYSLSDDELYKSVERDIENARLKAEHFASAGIPVLNINAGLNVNDCVKEASGFINDHI